MEGQLELQLMTFLAGAASGNDYSKDKQFCKLNAAKDNIKVKVVRDGQQTLVDNGDVVVGDLLQLDTGDKIVADGITTEFHGMVVDEASLTGESEPVKKGEDDVFCRSGTQVCLPCCLPTSYAGKPEAVPKADLCMSWRNFRHALFVAENLAARPPLLIRGGIFPAERPVYPCGR